MSGVSAEENITVGDGADSASDYIELDSEQGYGENDIGENPILDDENISENDINRENYPDSLDKHSSSANYGFKDVAYANAASDKNIGVHKSFSYSHYSRSDDADVEDNEYDIDGMVSNFKSLDGMGVEALEDIVHGEDIFEQTYSSYRQCCDYLKIDSFENLNKIGDVFNSNMHINAINSLKYDLISFMDAGVKYAESSIMNFKDVGAFLDIFDKIMNQPSTHIAMANIPSSNYNPTLRNDKNYSDYSFYQDAELIINSYDLNDEMESDINISDMPILQDDISLMNQTFELNDDVCMDSYYEESDLQLPDDADCLSDAQDNSYKTAAIQSLKFAPQINCLSDNVSQGIQHTFYHMIGCECTNTSFTKQHNSHENLPKVSEFDTIAGTEQEDNHDHFLFKKYNVNSPFVDTTSIFTLFGVIEIKIP